MSRPIDADESINRIVKIRPANPKQSDYSHGVDVGLAMAMVAIEEQPTIDPVRKGKWLQNPDDTAGEPFYICSQCGHGSYDITKFCKNCGADMRGEQDG